MKSTLSLALLLTMVSCGNRNDDTDTLTAWQPGEMDIHFIYTGRGESNFMIMPDGTTMLIDAGDYDPETYPMMCDALPDTTRRAGEWISRYLSRVNPGEDYIDYLMISHFHDDHMGNADNPAPSTQGRNPDYVLTGIARVGEDFRFGHLFDRGYPDYNYPRPIDDIHTDNYRAFVKWQKENRGLQQDEFKVGALDQIALQNDPEKYRGTFSIRNLASSGKVWMGGDSTICCYDLNPDNLNSKNENTRSLAIRVDYGPFSFYTGGDLTGKLKDVEGNRFLVDSLASIACGEVDLCKTNHHGYLDAMSKGFLDNVRAKHYVMSVWDWQHTQPNILSRIAETRVHDEEPLVLYGNIPDTLRIAYADEPWFQTVSPHYGHIIVRVSEGGKSYRIFVVDATDESMHVIASYGPFNS